MEGFFIVTDEQYPEDAIVAFSEDAGISLRKLIKPGTICAKEICNGLNIEYEREAGHQRFIGLRLYPPVVDSAIEFNKLSEEEKQTLKDLCHQVRSFAVSLEKRLDEAGVEI